MSPEITQHLKTQTLWRTSRCVTI